MDKHCSISSSKYISSALDNVILNSEINLAKMKEIITSLDRAAKGIIIPILKIKKKISMKFDLFAKDYAEIKEKAESANKEIVTHQEESKSDMMNITDIQLNQKYAINHENMISFYESIANNIDLFTRLFNSNEYDNLIRGFDELIPDNKVFSEDEEDKEKEEILRISRTNIKLKKPKRPIYKRPAANRKILKRIGAPSANKKKIKPKIKKRLKDFELLEILHKNFPSNSYVQKVSKTFISRRLYKKVIYRHVFDYKENGDIEENKLRSAGETTVYKYAKFNIKFDKDEFQNLEQIDELLGKELRQEFTKLDYDNKIYIVGGKMACLAIELVNRVLRQNLLSEYAIKQVILEFYEFYEELVNEFDEREKNVKIVTCDEKYLSHLRDDFKNLELVRDYIKEIRQNEE